MFGLFRLIRDRKNRKALKERLDRMAEEEKERRVLERLRVQLTPLPRPPRRREDDPSTVPGKPRSFLNDDLYPYQASHHRMKDDDTNR